MACGRGRAGAKRGHRDVTDTKATSRDGVEPIDGQYVPMAV